MDTTKLGKWLVFINVTLSLVFLAWAIGLYTNQVHWNTPPGDSGQRIQGMVDELKGEITQLKSKLQRLSPVEDQVAYHQLFGDLVALEQYRKGLGEQALGALA